MKRKLWQKRKKRRTVRGIRRGTYTVKAMENRSERKKQNKSKKQKKTNQGLFRKKQARRVVRGIDTRQYTIGPVRQKKKRNRRAAKRAGLSKRRGGLQSAAIVVLTVTMVAQSGWLWTRQLDLTDTPKGTIVHTIARWIGNRNAGVSDTVEPAAYPVKIAVRSDTGLYGIQYSADGIAQTWTQMEDLWSTALVEAREMETASMDDYTRALQNNMVFLEFDGSVPLSLIAGWMGAKTPEGGDNCVCGGLLLSCESADNYRLYLRDAATGQLYSAQTDVSDALFASMAQNFTANDCTMAAETDTEISPDTLLFSQAQSFQTVSFQSFTGSASALLDVLHIDGQAAQENAYVSREGASVYVSEDVTVRINTAGLLTYHAENGIRAYDEALIPEEARQKCAQLGRTLSANLLESMNSGGEAHLSKAYTTDDGRYVTVFSLHIDGVPVDNELGYFARYEFEDGAMVHADIVLRPCEVTGSATAVMPEAIAAAVRQDADALLSLRYTDTGVLLEEDSASDSTTQTDSGTLNTGTPDVDDSWVDASDVAVEQNNGWTDSDLWNSTNNTLSGVTDGTGQTVGSTLSGSGTNASATAQWKFLLYHPETEEPTGTARGIDLQPEDITYHMPDFLTPLREGGAGL